LNINYNNLSGEYDKVRDEDSYIQDILLKYIPFNLNAHTHIDLGCGTCKETFILKDKFKNFIGIDFSKNMLEIASKRIQDGIFIPSDLQKDIPLLDNMADSISIIYFLHHITNKKHFLSEVNRIMKKDGILIVITNTIEQLEQREHYKYFKDALLINKSRFLKKDQLEAILNENNFIIKESKQINFPITFWGEELLPIIQSLAFDSVFSLIDKDDFAKGLEEIKVCITELKQKIACFRDRYLIVCKKGVE
jgi:ubiquinone/menaquinone biosynthesis C-methylase UbiE